jgi:hypothetical protein
VASGTADDRVPNQVTLHCDLLFIKIRPITRTFMLYNGLLTYVWRRVVVAVGIIH